MITSAGLLSKEGYLGLPKRIGSVQARELEYYYAIAQDLTEHTADRPHSSFHMIAGSLAVELALTAEPAEPSAADALTENRIRHIHSAMSHFAIAADLEFDLLERGFKGFDDQEDWRRSLLQLTFENAYIDMITNEHTADTKHDILEQLSAHERYARSIANHAERKTQRQEGIGLLREILYLKSAWFAKHSSDDATVFPSTFRGGSGVFRPNETHDVVSAKSTADSTYSFDPIEVKGRSKSRLRRTKVMLRYDGRVAYVDEKSGAISYTPAVADTDSLATSLV